MTADPIQQVLAEDSRVGYALVFGSQATGRASTFSDVDIAIGLKTGATCDARAIGELASRLERAAERPIDLIVLDEASPGLAYRAFRDGRVLFVSDRAALVRQETLTVLQYLDFEPVERLCAGGVLDAAIRGPHGR